MLVRHSQSCKAARKVTVFRGARPTFTSMDFKTRNWITETYRLPREKGISQFKVRTRTTCGESTFRRFIYEVG